MKTIIAGSRSICEPERLLQAIVNSRFFISEVVCGLAAGVDILGQDWARSQIPPVPVTYFPADWATHGKAAGPSRNQEMVDYADQAIVLWDNRSRGTADLLRRIRRANLPVSLFTL